MNQRNPIRQQVEDFLAEKKRLERIGDMSTATTSYYTRNIKNLFLPWCEAAGVTDGAAFTVSNWNAYVEAQLARGLSIHSVRTYLLAARIFLKSLDVPLKKFEMPRAPKRLMEILTREEIDRLEDAATNDRDKLIIRALANTGIRLGGLTGLKLNDLREITHPVRYYRIRVTEKGNKQREVPIDRETFKRLKAFAETGGQRTYIFPALTYDRATKSLVMLGGKRLGNPTVDRMFRRAKAAAGIDKPCTPHKLRHAYITYLLQQHVPIEKVADIAGHADLTMVMKVYKHLVPDDLSRAVEGLFEKAAKTEEESNHRRRLA